MSAARTWPGEARYHLDPSAFDPTDGPRAQLDRLAKRIVDEQERWLAFALVAAIVAADRTQPEEERALFRSLRDVYRTRAMGLLSPFWKPGRWT